MCAERRMCFLKEKILLTNQGDLHILLVYGIIKDVSEQEDKCGERKEYF